MNDYNFFSKDSYIYLPSKRNPRVILAVTTSDIARKAFNLYNPFSKKAQWFKHFCKFILVYLNRLALPFMKIQKGEKSEFVSYLEKQLNKSITTSVYRSTDTNKVIIQLQTDGQIYGYLKFPLNKKGIGLIENEKKAILLLSKKNLTPPFLFSSYYKEIPFFIVANIEGEIVELHEEKIESILQKFEKNYEFQLNEHPRIKGLQKKIKVLNIEKYSLILKRIINNSTCYYKETLEHGDFTPWNIINTAKGPILFDFEFFEERGIVFFDLIKYHFQIGRLLKQKNHIELTSYILKKIKKNEAKSLLGLFLIKEIIRKKELDESFDFENNMLNYLCE